MPSLLPYLDPTRQEAGVDEAGRGCLAGPVVAAAVLLPKDYAQEALTDSKQVKESVRHSLREEIEACALAWGVGFASPAEIDQHNILNATYLAMHRAIAKLGERVDFLLIDGNRFRPYAGLSHQCIIKGDGKLLPIAAASILAKTHRDAYMQHLAERYPGYGWETNKGYPTPAHKKAIRALGFTPHHRKSFRIGDEQFALGF